MLQPKLPNYDASTWRSAPFPARVRMVCQSWAEDGYGTPLAIYGAYTLKIVLYVAIWLVSCTFAEGQDLADFGSWWASQESFSRFILWTMLFEGLGFGCGSGPLTARYLPPLGGFLYFLRPGTTKLPLLRGVPIVGGHRRTVLDVGLYATTITVLGHALLAPAVTAAHLVALVVLVPLMALGDKTLFLVFRSEHYLSITICLLFADWIAGSKVVWLAIWWWAATSKLNHHFPAVMCVMTSNCPWTRWTPLRRWVYRDAPDDLNPSPIASAMAHFGTATEYVVPLLLVWGEGGPLTVLGLFVMTGFHLFILSNVPMGVPLEWNVLMIYGAFVLYGVHADVSLFSVGAPVLWIWLMLFHVLTPALGSMLPRHMSFLLSMRYYAGNWPYNVWLFRGESVQKLRALTRSAPLPRDQLRWFYDEDTVDLLLSKVIAFRSMHLLGRVLRHVVPQAVDDIDAYEWLDGELIAGIAIGWNFGDGHLGNTELLEAIQTQCSFEPGELRVISVESQPIHVQTADWTVTDAATGQLASGTVTIRELLDGDPWPAEIG